MVYDKEYIQYWMRFVFNLNKNSFEAIKMICSA